MSTPKSFHAFTVNAEVEIATPREGSTKSSHLNCGMLSRAFQDKEVADSLLAWSMAGKRQTAAIIDMLTAIDEEQYGDAPTFLLSSAAGRDEFMEAAGLNESAQEWNDSKLLSHLHSAFPGGTLLRAKSQMDGTEEVFINFGLVSSMSTIIGGVAEGFAGEVVALVAYVLAPDESGVDSALVGKIAMLKAGIQGWLANAVSSHSILKRLMKGKKGLKLAGKIRNASHIPVLNHEAGELPKLGMSIHDDRLKELRKLPNGKVDPAYCWKFPEGDDIPDGAEVVGKWRDEDTHEVYNLVWDVELMHQMVIGVGRDPMPMTVAAELILLELEGYQGEPGTDIICGDGFSFDVPNETTTDSRKMTIAEMRSLRDGNRVNPACADDKGSCKGTAAAHEGDSDGDGDTIENLDGHKKGCLPD
jgi:hypothetical protein